MSQVQLPKVHARPHGAPGVAVGMAHPERWLAVLRMVVGFWFLKTLWTKVGVTWVGGVLPLPAATERWIGFLPTRLEGWAETNPLGWYRGFLEGVAIPNAEVFAQLTVFGEVAVGIGLTFGILTGWSALGGLFLMANYVLASAGVPFNQQGLHVVLTACLIAFLAARAGRAWGVDALLARRFPEGFRRIPLA